MAPRDLHGILSRRNRYANKNAAFIVHLLIFIMVCPFLIMAGGRWVGRGENFVFLRNNLSVYVMA